MDELPQLKARWDKFEIMMESHQMMIKDQVRTRRLECIVSSSSDLLLSAVFYTSSLLSLYRCK